ncbi:hypothetical protein, partial [Xenorhabdus bovienii]|uniref:hypothetical protein n=1 Tax=Xenorhabdus bovienii TaxID=40576 RepID=UPI0023B20840
MSYSLSYPVTIRPVTPAYQPKHSPHLKANLLNFEPHSRSGRAMPLVPVASSPLITGASLAFLLLYRHTFFSINPHQRVIAPLTCIWLPTTLGIRGCFITAA